MSTLSGFKSPACGRIDWVRKSWRRFEPLWFAAVVILFGAREALAVQPAGAEPNSALGPTSHTVIAVLDLVVVVALIARRMDVRLVLLLGSLPLFATTNGLSSMIIAVASEMANAGTVVPICAAI